MRTPDVDLNYEKLVALMRAEFARTGALRGLQYNTLEQEAKRQLDINRTIFRTLLIEGWEDRFPGVPFSEQLLGEHLETFLEQKKPEVLRRLTSHLKRVNGWMNVCGILARKEQLCLWALVATSFATFPLWFILFFSTSNTKMMLGFWGAAANVVAFLAVSYLNWRSYRNIVKGV